MARRVAGILEAAGTRVVVGILEAAGTRVVVGIQEVLIIVMIIRKEPRWQ